MNDLDYAKMIEIPVSSYDLTYKKPKRYKWRRPEVLKQELIKTVNEQELELEGAESEPLDTNVQERNLFETVEITTAKEEKHKNKKRFAVDIIAAQVAVIIVLALTIMLTNIFWQDSGINSLVRGVFASGNAEAEDKAYTEFAPTAPTRTAEVSLEAGVMAFSGAGSIYSVCDGVVTKVTENADKYDITIEYSPSFTSVISGVDYAYYGLGDAVYRSLPVCYSGGGEVKVYLYDNGKLLTNYTLDNGKIIWQS